MFVLKIICIVLCQGIEPAHIYNGISNGIVAKVSLPKGQDIGHLILLDYKNKALAPPVAVTAGNHDLVSRITKIKSLQQSALVQLLIDDTPFSAPIVINPLFSRKVPITESATRSDGKTSYLNIIGWRDEAEDDDMGALLSGWRVYPEESVIMHTTEGDIQLQMRPDAAPNAVWNFLELARHGFYRNTTFHRIVPMTSKGHPFVIQGGDPTGTGSGGPGRWLPIEQSTLQHDFGVISMARADDPDSAGSQFFFCLSREGTARLDGQYCAFGETVDGQDTIKKIAGAPLENPATGKPINPPLVQSVRLRLADPRQPLFQN